MDELEARKSALEEELAASEPEQPILLHPGLSDIYQAKVTNLSSALNDPAIKTEATSIIRSLLSEIRLIPEDDGLAIELVGELAGLLSLGQTKTASEARASGRSVTLVAGAGFGHCLIRVEYPEKVDTLRPRWVRRSAYWRIIRRTTHFCP